MWQSVSVGVLFYVMSLSIGKAGLPLAHRLVGDVEAVGQLLLSDIFFFAQMGHKLPELDVVQGARSFHSLLS